MAAFSKIRKSGHCLEEFTEDFNFKLSSILLADWSVWAKCPIVLVGGAKITKLFIWNKFGTLPRVTLPSKRVTLHPGSPCPPSQLCNFSYKQLAAIYKETYEKLSLPGWLGMEGNPLTLLPVATLLHINRPSESNEREVKDYGSAMDRSIDRLINGLTDWLTDWLIDWLIDWLVEVIDKCVPVTHPPPFWKLAKLLSPPLAFLNLIQVFSLHILIPALIALIALLLRPN